MPEGDNRGINQSHQEKLGHGMIRNNYNIPIPSASILNINQQESIINQLINHD